MSKSDLRAMRMALEWGAAVACIIALIQGSGSLSHLGVSGLVLIGSSAACIAAWEHDWLRAPYPVGKPVKAVVVFSLMWIPMVVLGWLVWPKPPTISDAHPDEQKQLITSLVQYVQINRIDEISDELSFNLRVQMQRQRFLSTNPSLHFNYGQFGYEVTYRAREGNWNGDLIIPGMTLNSLGVHEGPTEVAFVVRTPKMTEDYVHLKSFSDDLLLPPTIKWDLDQYMNNWGESESAIADVLNAQAQQGHVFSDQDIGLLQKQMFQQIKSPDVFVKKLVEDARQYIAASIPH